MLIVLRLLTWTVFVGGGSSLLPWGLAMLTHDFESSWQTGWDAVQNDFIHMSGVSWGSWDGWGGWDSLSTDACSRKAIILEGSLSLFLQNLVFQRVTMEATSALKLGSPTQVTYPSF